MQNLLFINADWTILSLHLKLLKIIVKYTYEADKHVQLIEMTSEKFIKKWTPYSQLVT